MTGNSFLSEFHLPGKAFLSGLSSELIPEVAIELVIFSAEAAPDGAQELFFRRTVSFKKSAAPVGSPGSHWMSP